MLLSDATVLAIFNHIEPLFQGAVSLAVQQFAALLPRNTTVC